MAGDAGEPPGGPGSRADVNDQPEAGAAPPEAADQTGGGGAAEPPAAAGGGAAAEEEGAEYWFSEEDGDDGDLMEDAEEGDYVHDWDDEGLLEEDLLDEEGWEEDMMDDEEWEEEDGELGSESSEEPDAEEEASQRLAADTAGRHVCPGWAAYPVPTVSHHFQSADALAVAEAPGGGLLAATFDHQGVAVWLLPAAGSMQALGAAAQPKAVRLGGFQTPRDAYSMALSPGGRYLATGGEGGLLALYSLDPTAPPRPRLPPGRVNLEGLNYFYSPLLLPQQLRRLQQQGERQLQQGGQQPPQQGGHPAGGEAAVGQEGQGPGRRQEGRVPEHERFVGFLDNAIEHSRQMAEVQQAVADCRGAPLTHEALRARMGQPGARPTATAEAAEQNRGFLRAVMGQDLALLGAYDGAQQQQPPPPQQLGVDQAPPLLGLNHWEQQVHLVLQRAGLAAMLLSDAVAVQQGGNDVELVAAAVGGANQLASRGPTEQPLLRAAAEVQVEQQGGKGKQPVDDDLQQQQQRQQQQVQQQQQAGQGGAGNPAAVQLRGILALGMEQVQAKAVGFLHDGMCNGVRFGLVAGRQRLLAADQSGYIYVFEMPAAPAAQDSAPGSSSSSSGVAPPAPNADLQARQLMCAGLGQPSPHWRMRAVNFFSALQHPLGAQVVQQRPPEAPRPGNRAGTRAAAAAAAAGCEQGSGGTAASEGVWATAALGPFPTPCNLAVASPDGRWVAAVGDSQAVYLADQAAGFAWRQLPFDLAGSRDDVEQGLEAGAQYACWNASSSLLAVSSDALHAVFVWEPASGRMVMRVEGHAKPCLCIGFAPWDDRLLVYSEESKQVHMRRVPEVGGASGADGVPACCEQNARDDLALAQHGVQLLRLPIVPGDAGAAHAMVQGNRRRRVTGMALGGSSLLLTTRQGTLLRYLSSQPWDPSQHAGWPPAFRAAVQALLLCSHRQQEQAAQRPGEQAAGLWLLPLPLVQHIVQMAAGQRSDWLAQQAAAVPAAAAAAVVGAGVEGGQVAGS